MRTFLNIKDMEKPEIRSREGFTSECAFIYPMYGVYTVVGWHDTVVSPSTS